MSVKNDSMGHNQIDLFLLVQSVSDAKNASIMPSQTSSAPYALR